MIGSFGAGGLLIEFEKDDKTNEQRIHITAKPYHDIGIICLYLMLAFNNLNFLKGASCKTKP